MTSYRLAAPFQLVDDDLVSLVALSVLALRASELRAFEGRRRW